MVCTLPRLGLLAPDRGRASEVFGTAVDFCEAKWYTTTCFFVSERGPAMKPNSRCVDNFLHCHYLIPDLLECHFSYGAPLPWSCRPSPCPRGLCGWCELCWSQAGKTPAAGDKRIFGQGFRTSSRNWPALIQWYRVLGSKAKKIGREREREI